MRVTRGLGVYQINFLQKIFTKQVLAKNYLYLLFFFQVILNDSFFYFLVLNYDLFLLSRELRINNLFNLVSFIQSLQGLELE